MLRRTFTLQLHSNAVDHGAVEIRKVTHTTRSGTHIVRWQWHEVATGQAIARTYATPEDALREKGRARAIAESRDEVRGAKARAANTRDRIRRATAVDPVPTIAAGSGPLASAQFEAFANDSTATDTKWCVRCLDCRRWLKKANGLRPVYATEADAQCVIDTVKHGHDSTHRLVAKRRTTKQSSPQHRVTLRDQKV